MSPYHARNETWWQVPVARDLFVTVRPLVTVTVTVNEKTPCEDQKHRRLETPTPPTAGRPANENAPESDATPRTSATYQRRLRSSHSHPKCDG